MFKKGGVLLFSVHTIAAWAIGLRPLIKIFDKNHPYHFLDSEIKTLLTNTGFELDIYNVVPIHVDKRVGSIPDGTGLLLRAGYHVAFRVMNTFYGVAKAV